MSSKKVQEFMDLVKKVQQRSDLQKLQAYFVHFSKPSQNRSEAELCCLTENIVQYVDVVIDLSANMGFREQIKTCTKWLDPLDQIISNKDICVVFIKRVTQKMFDILIEEDVRSLCVKKELLRTFINSVRKWPREIIRKTVQELPNMYLFKIVDSLSTYGDFDFQVILIEIVFHMYGKSAILSKLPDLLPESEELSHSFANINGDTFHEDVRKFLNILNQNSKKVFSVVCKDVFFGRIKCGEPMENVNGLWVDFNRSERSVSWYTTADSLCDADLDEDDAAGRSHILFFVSDVELVQIYRSPKTNKAIVYVKLREPCLISMKANIERVESADHVKFILSCESDKAKTLLSQVLPAMFEHKLQNNPFKVSLGSEIVHEPLEVSQVRKQAKSDSTKSKSDTSSFSERSNLLCGTEERGSSTLHCISPSTKCDVISISDGSMHSNQSSVSLIPKSDDTENSLYVTAQMIQLDSPQHDSEVKYTEIPTVDLTESDEETVHAPCKEVVPKTKVAMGEGWLSKPTTSKKGEPKEDVKKSAPSKEVVPKTKIAMGEGWLSKPTTSKTGEPKEDVKKSAPSKEVVLKTKVAMGEGWLSKPTTSKKGEPKEDVKKSAPSKEVVPKTKIAMGEGWLSKPTTSKKGEPKEDVKKSAPSKEVVPKTKIAMGEGWLSKPTTSKKGEPKEDVKKSAPSKEVVPKTKVTEELPLKNLEDFYAFEERLSTWNSTDRNSFILYLRSFGGHVLVTKTNNILRHLFADCLACKFNFYGKGDKLAIKDTKIVDIIVDAVLNRNHTKTEVENAIKVWLKGAPQRAKNAAKKLQLDK